MAPARPVAVDGVRPDRPAEGARAERARDDARPAAHPRRQPRRRDPLRQRDRGDDPAAERPQPGARPRPEPAAAARTNGAITDLDGAARVRARGDPAALADRPRLRLHHRARLGAPAAAADRAPRGRRDPAARPARVRASRRRRDRGRGRRDRRAALGRLERRRVPPPAARGRRAPRGGAARADPPRRRRHLRGVDRRTTSSARSSGSSSRASGGAADVARLAVDAALPRLSCPLLVLAYCVGAPPRAAGGPRGSRPKGSCRPRRGAACRWRRHIPFALFAAAIALVVLRARPADREPRAAAARGHGDPRLRRLEQHARQGPRADPDRRGEGRGPRLRRAAAELDPDRRRGVQRQRRHRPASRPTSRQDVLAAIKRLSVSGGTSLGQGIFTSLERDRGQAARRSTSRRSTATPAP